MSQAHSASHFGESRNYWWNEDYLQLLAERFELENCSSLADIGCGEGMMAFRFAQYLPENAQVFGLDMESQHIKKAKQKSKKQALPMEQFHFEQGMANQLPWADNSMDICICQTLLIHVEHPLAVIKEMQRITKPGGLVVALEPNNLVPHLMFDSYEQTDYDIEDVMQMIEVRLRCEKGKKELGEGFNSLGDALPDLYLEAGLEDVEVFLSDKASSLIPPYNNREKRVRAAQLIEWIESKEGGFGYEENWRYYSAGGGKKSDFENYWQRVNAYQSTILKELKEQTFISSGGNLMYIVGGRVPSLLS